MNIPSNRLGSVLVRQNIINMPASSRSFVLESLNSQRKQKKPLKSNLKTSTASSSKSQKASTSSAAASKASKVRAEELDWKKLSTDSYEGGTFDGDEGGMLLLEEVDGVDIQWEEDQAGNKKAVLLVSLFCSQHRSEYAKAPYQKSKNAVALSNRQAQKRKRAHEEDIVRDDSEDENQDEGVSATANEEMDDATEFKSAFPDSEDEDDVAGGLSDIEVKQEDDEDQAVSGDDLEAVAKPSTKKAKAAKAEKTIQTPPSLHERIKDITFDEELLPGWKDQALHPLLKKSLFALGFSRPSDIQAKAVPVGIQPGKDVVGVAETVSMIVRAGLSVRR